MTRLWLVIFLLAQTTSTQPAVTVDLSTPKSAAKSLFQAVAAGDAKAVRATLDAADAAQGELATAMANLIVNGKRLGDAAREQFGKAGDPIGRGMLDPEDLTRLEKAAVTEQGDSATIELPESGRPRPMVFRRRDGQWRLVVTDFAAAAPANSERQTRLVRMMAAVLDESAREVAEGKFKTPDAAVTAIQKRLHEVMLTFTRPATTTRASTSQSIR